MKTLTDADRTAKRDARIRAHAKALAHRGPGCYSRGGGCRKHWVSMNAHVWMPLARHWKMPIAQIKAIVRPHTAVTGDA